MDSELRDGNSSRNLEDFEQTDTNPSCDSTTLDIKPSVTVSPLETKAESIYKTHIKLLIGFIRSKFGNGPPDPEDIAHDAFERLVNSPQFEEIKNIKAFLWRTAHNLTLNYKRSELVKERNQLNVEQVFFQENGCTLSPERVLLANTEIEKINKALRAMPSQRRFAFVLYRFEQLTFCEVATRMEISRAAATKHIARACAEIETALRELDENDLNGGST
ncbi:MAG: sigma-70 family RNA polymerase sigma factor [Pseudomonadota bacterium]